MIASACAMAEPSAVDAQDVLLIEIGSVGMSVHGRPDRSRDVHTAVDERCAALEYWGELADLLDPAWVDLLQVRRARPDDA